MPGPITQLLSELRTDHRNMARLLKLLEGEGDRIYAGGDPDLRLMGDIMRYMSTYSDAVHHPKEDRLYAELRAVRPDRAGGMGRVSEEHRVLEQQGTSLLHRLEDSRSKDADSLRSLVTDALRYADLLRKHMRWEEADLFRRLDKLVAEGHDATSKAVVIDRRDPLFGGEVEKRFEDLYQRIANDA